MFNVIDSSKIKNFKNIQEFLRTPEIFKDNKMLFKKQGQNEFR